jgi:hypothetical protein
VSGHCFDVLAEFSVRLGSYPDVLKIKTLISKEVNNALVATTKNILNKQITKRIRRGYA